MALNWEIKQTTKGWCSDKDVSVAKHRSRADKVRFRLTFRNRSWVKAVNDADAIIIAKDTERSRLYFKGASKRTGYSLVIGEL